MAVTITVIKVKNCWDVESVPECSDGTAPVNSIYSQASLALQGQVLSRRSMITNCTITWQRKKKQQEDAK